MQARIAPSLGGGFAGTPNKTWGTQDYEDPALPAVFFGLYGLPDFFALWKHKGERYVLWAGSDITHFINGYWLDEKGLLKIDPRQLAPWLNIYATHYVENKLEHDELKEVGIDSEIVPSFLGNIDDYHPCYTPGPTRLYTSVSGDNFNTYGWNEIPDLATKHPDVEFHLYGNNEVWTCQQKNVVVHGRVSQDQMNSEIKTMTGAIRLTKHDGFSEILAKSILWGQYPVSPYIEYPLVAKHINDIKDKKIPNLTTRTYYINKLNQYPWNGKNNKSAQ